MHKRYKLSVNDTYNLLFDYFSVGLVLAVSNTLTSLNKNLCIRWCTLSNIFLFLDKNEWSQSYAILLDVVNIIGAIQKLQVLNS